MYIYSSVKLCKSSFSCTWYVYLYVITVRFLLRTDNTPSLTYPYRSVLTILWILSTCTDNHSTNSLFLCLLSLPHSFTGPRNRFYFRLYRLLSDIRCRKAFIYVHFINFNIPNWCRLLKCFDYSVCQRFCNSFKPFLCKELFNINIPIHHWCIWPSCVRS